MSEFNHISVLKSEVIEALNIREDGFYIDATLGGGGHSVEILKRLSDKGRLLGIDRDGDAIMAAKERLKDYFDKITIVTDRFSEMKQILDSKFNEKKADGILLDLGVSSFQLDTADRGFSYINEAALDMRMDKNQEFSAASIVNTYSEENLAKIIFQYGEDKFAKAIAKKIIQAREDGYIHSTARLADIIMEAYPAKFRAGRGHPAKKAFQAIRIECNGELEELKLALQNFPKCLAPKGRMAVITFHSLEDRLVKNTFRDYENPCVCPPNFAVCICGKVPLGTVITKKPILPTEKETAQNKRAKSAKLRVFQMV